jgi:hypothetical protein
VSLNDLLKEELTEISLKRLPYEDYSLKSLNVTKPSTISQTSYLNLKEGGNINANLSPDMKQSAVRNDASSLNIN